MTAIQVLFSLIFVGVTVLFSLIYVVIMVHGQTPSVVGGPVKSPAAMTAARKVLLLLAFVVMLVIMSCVYNVVMIQKINDHLFELTLMWFLAFLVLMIDKVHNYKRELRKQGKVKTKEQLEMKLETQAEKPNGKPGLATNWLKGRLHKVTVVIDITILIGGLTAVVIGIEQLTGRDIGSLTEQLNKVKGF